LRLQYRNIKDETGSLSREFVTELRDAFSIQAFVETGTYQGDTLARVCDDFDVLYSIELSESYHSMACARFSQNPKIHLLKGDSSVGLQRVLQDLPPQRALCWLDAHFSGGHTARGASNSPVSPELQAILRYPERSDVILIDDLRYFWQAQPGFSQHDALRGYPSVRDLITLLSSGAREYDCFALSDALLAIPSNLRGKYTPSPLLQALTESRLGPTDATILVEVENLISTATEPELSALSQIPDYLAGQSAYGLAGHYYYWRALVRFARGENASAETDADLASKCGVVPAGSLIARFGSGRSV
jgi:hypothetical protein